MNRRRLCFVLIQLLIHGISIFISKYIKVNLRPRRRQGIYVLGNLHDAQKIEIPMKVQGLRIKAMPVTGFATKWQMVIIDVLRPLLCTG